MTWAVAAAKAKFSELVECAQKEGPQEITRNGKVVGVLVSPAEWEKSRLAPEENARTMSEFFKNSPLRDSGIDLTRDGRGPRPVDL